MSKPAPKSQQITSPLLDELFKNPPGTRYSVWRGPFPCKHVPWGGDRADTCGLQIQMRFAESPVGAKVHNAVFEPDQITVHVHRQDMETAMAQQQEPQPQQPPIVEQSRQSIYPSSGVNPPSGQSKPLLTDRDKAIQQMHEEKGQWHQEDGERHTQMMLKMDLLITVVGGLTHAINRYVDFEIKQREQQEGQGPTSSRTATD